MSLAYGPAAFHQTDLDVLHEHVRRTGLAMLVTSNTDGPQVSHLPLLLDAAAGRKGTLIGHLSRGNPQVRDGASLGSALAVFPGPDAYVSPSWYATKRTDPRVVPTWNYVVVHARGRLELFDDPAALKTLLKQLTEQHESRFATPWKVDDAPAEFLERMMRGIVGVRLTIDQIEGRYKLSQNRTWEDQRGVVEALGASDRGRDREVAALMPPPTRD